MRSIVKYIAIPAVTVRSTVPATATTGCRVAAYVVNTTAQIAATTSTADAARTREVTIAASMHRNARSIHVDACAPGHASRPVSVSS